MATITRSATSEAFCWGVGSVVIDLSEKDSIDTTDEAVLEVARTLPDLEVKETPAASSAPSPAPAAPVVPAPTTTTGSNS